MVSYALSSVFTFRTIFFECDDVISRRQRVPQSREGTDTRRGQRAEHHTSTPLETEAAHPRM